MTQRGAHPSTASPGPSAASEWRRNWPAVTAGAIGFSTPSMNVYTLGVFMIPLQTAFGWSRSEITGGLTIVGVAGVLFAPFAGALIDRVGARWVAITGVALYCAATACFGLVNSSIYSWFAVWMLLCAGSVLIKPTVWMTAVSRLFTTSRGMAMALTLCGTAIGSAIAPVLASYLLQTVGWRAAYASMAGIWALVALTAMFFFFDRQPRQAAIARADPRPEAKAAAHQLPGLDVKAALKGRPFWILFVVTLLLQVGVLALVVHFVPLLISLDIPAKQAPFIAAMIGICSVVGRLITGLLLDRYQGAWVGAALFLLPVISAGLFLYDPSPTLAVASVAACVLGAAYGAELDVISYLSSRYFGLRRFATLYGCITAMLSLAAAVGPALAGRLFDISRTYTATLWAVVAFCTVSAILTATLPRYPDFSTEPPPQD